ncbi:MAG: glycosyltransferase [Glaciimonas sp.]|nr:glycosyltransferase [Glaciimonas sp.]
MLDGPKVSILMNCYNGQKYLREAIDSILNQTYENWEIVFWDNRSDDHSAEIFKSYQDKRFKYFLAENHTDLGGGRAKAWEYLSGDLIAVLDVDDVWLPFKLEKQIPFFDDPEVGIVISDTLFFNNTSEKPLYGGKYPPIGWVFEHLMTQYYVSLETLIVRKAAVSKLARAFDPEFSAIADFDLVVRLSRVSKLSIVPEILAKWRVHHESDTWRYPLSFVKEKEKWITKQISEDPEFYAKHATAVGLFKNKNIREKVIYMLCDNHRMSAIKNLLQSRFDHWHSWALLILCFLPLSSFLLAKKLKKRSDLA